MVNQELEESQEIVQQRSQAITDYLKSQWQIDRDRLTVRVGTQPQSRATLRLTVKSLRIPPVETIPGTF